MLYKKHSLRNNGGVVLRNNGGVVQGNNGGAIRPYPLRNNGGVSSIILVYPAAQAGAKLPRPEMGTAGDLA
jgi:hypothetical protein